MSHYEDLNTTKIALIGFISTVIVFALILLMMVLFHREMAEQNQLKVIDQPMVEYDTLVADQRAKLASYRWIDRKKKTVQIPIKQAIDLVLEELEKSPATATKKEKTPAEPPQTEKAEGEKPQQEAPSKQTPQAKEGDHAP
jgi:hypothetical protein